MKSLGQLKYEAEEALKLYNEAKAIRKVFKVTRTYEVTTVNEVEAETLEEAKEKSYMIDDECSLGELLELDDNWQLLKSECKRIKEPSKWEG